jgi:integrase
VQYALKPLLRKLGIDDEAGLHAFRHGLATEPAEASVPITVLQTQMRHADVKTTLRIYSHSIPAVPERCDGMRKRGNWNKGSDWTRSE